MLGIMGVDALFVSAGGAHSTNKTILRFSEDDPEIILSCDGDIMIKSISGAEPVVESYSDLDTSSVSIAADAETDVTIIGNVTVLKIDDTSINYYKSNCNTLSVLKCFNTNIIELDVSKNTSLEELDCHDCPEIKELDISNNIALRELIVEGTSISSLDVSKNVALQILGVSNTSISSLDVSKNVALQSLAISYTNITELDVSKNTSLEELGMDGTNISSLDVSKNPLTIISLTDCVELSEIKYPATNSDVSTGIANAITAATADNGTVYTDSAADYYSTIADAATAKGWTIEQLQ